MLNVSVVVCVYNRADRIAQCLNSILYQNFDSFELIVIDDGSSDKTKEILEKFSPQKKVRIITNKKNFGLMVSRNIGIKQALGKFIVFTDSDCIAEKDWLANLITPFNADANIMIVGGQILDPPVKNYYDIVDKGIYYISDKSRYVKNIFGGNMAFRREFLQDSKFDETLKYGGDEYDLCLQGMKIGKKIFYQHSAKVVHLHRQGLVSNIIRSFLLGLGNGYIKLKHKIFPFFNIKTWLLITIIILLTIGLIFKINYLFLSLFFGVFILIIIYEEMRRKKDISQIVISLPMRFIIEISHSLGYIFSLFNIFFIRIRR
jgi:glycosyltransferase involved in cell wall biosynthesis